MKAAPTVSTAISTETTLAAPDDNRWTLADDGAPPWQCPGPAASEVASLPFNLAAVLEHRCEAKRPNACVDLCDPCWAERRRGEFR